MPLEKLLCRFDSNLAPDEEGSGDVKYHLGTSVKKLNRFSDKEVTYVNCILTSQSTEYNINTSNIINNCLNRPVTTQQKKLRNTRTIN